MCTMERLGGASRRNYEAVYGINEQHVLLKLECGGNVILTCDTICI